MENTILDYRLGRDSYIMYEDGTCHVNGSPIGIYQFMAAVNAARRSWGESELRLKCVAL